MLLQDKSMAKVTCLVAEDSPGMRALIRSALLGYGIRTIYEASDGADALELTLEHRPHIVLCDWVMKPCGGGEFLRTLRADKDPLLSTTPVIIVTAHANRSTLKEAVAFGMHGFVAKPISPAILHGRIIEVLERQALQGRSKGLVGFDPSGVTTQPSTPEHGARPAAEV